jgi:shikimate dehydrogenase
MRIGLIGDPVAHSASPQMQGTAFRAAGLSDWTYELWHTPLSELAARIDAMRQDPGIGGCNVTVPHKQNVLPMLDVLSDDARALGAVNTIVKRDSGLWGDNTDWRGFLADLSHYDALPDKDTCVLVLGAGGSARGIVYGLCKRGCAVRIHNRNTSRAAALVRDLERYGDVRVVEDVYLAADDAGLIVNCTSAGMEPHDDSTPWPEGDPYPSHAALYDLVYKPRVTRLMRQAEAAGARAIGGIGMLAEQGAAAFELWTGVPAARVAGVMRRVLS